MAVAGAAVLAGCVLVLADTHAPATGILVAAWVASVVAIGALTTLGRALLLAVAMAIVPVVVAWLAFDSADTQGVAESCDPGCISFGGALMLVVPVAAVLAS